MSDTTNAEPLYVLVRGERCVSPHCLSAAQCLRNGCRLVMRGAQDVPGGGDE